MLVPRRHGSLESYKYGFQGQEKDDEIKGEGNSYDFGARMFDSRIGRWFAVDKQFYKQPGWSSYKAFNNSPLIFIDPDGNTEYLITKVIDHKNKETTIIIEIIDEDKLDEKVVHTDYYNKRYYTEFRDIVHSATVTIFEDGTTTVENSKTEYSTRYTRKKGFENFPEMPSINLNGKSNIIANDGYVLSSKWGKNGLAAGNKTGNKTAKDVDITALELLTTVVRGGDLPKGFEAVQSVLENTSEIIQTYFDANGIAGSIKMKNGKVNIDYEPEDKTNVKYQEIKPGYWINGGKGGNVVPRRDNKDTLVPSSKANKVQKEKDSIYQKDRAKAIKEAPKSRNNN